MKAEFRDPRLYPITLEIETTITYDRLREWVNGDSTATFRDIPAPPDAVTLLAEIEKSHRKSSTQQRPRRWIRTQRRKAQR